jgi:hypothetical protein
MARAQLWALSLLLGGGAACSQPSAPDVHSGQMSRASQPGPVSGLPFAQGRSFTALDEYLAFRKSRGAYDVPWYREIRPGVYELVSRRPPGAKPTVHTRDELERKFGFRR